MFMDYVVIRLHGDEKWGVWRGNWWDHVDEVGRLHWVKGWHVLPPEPILERESRQLDWGATLYEVTKAELVALADEPAWVEVDDVSAVEQRAVLSRLRDGVRYGIVYVES